MSGMQCWGVENSLEILKIAMNKIFVILLARAKKFIWMMFLSIIKIEGIMII
jgi:hypothetical protein